MATRRFDLRGFVLPLALLVLAEAAMRINHTESDTLARPSDVALALWEALRDGTVLTASLQTLGAALGGLAAAGLGNFCLRLAYPEDVNVMLLVWHLGAVFAVSALACAAGHYLLNWRSISEGRSG